MSDIRQARAALEARILTGPGLASNAERRAAFDETGLKGALQRLLGKVARGASLVTDDDVTGARAEGYSEDQIFELVVCAAVGAASRQHDAALRALDAAAAGKDPHAARDSR